MPAADDAEVAVVGAGPVGLITALLLARQGHDVTLLERREQPYPLPRAVALTADSLRALHLLGLGGALEPMVLQLPPTARAQVRNGDGTVLHSAPMPPGPDRLPAMAPVHLPDLERLLLDTAQAHPLITVVHGAEVTAVRPGRDAVELDIGGGPGLRAQLVVGADGANSVVRAQAGFELLDLGFAADWLVVDIRTDPDRVWDPLVAQLADPRRPATTVPSGPPGRRRFEFMCLPGEDRARMADVDTAWRLLGEHGVTPADAALVRHAVYTFAARWATTWNCGRVLIAGDAAHLMPPFMGQGMNSGIRDAVALSRRAHLVLTGRVPLTTFDAYTTERLAHVRSMIEAAVALGRVICETDPTLAAERDRRMLAGPPPPRPSWRLGAGTTRPDDPWAGLLLDQGRVGVAGRVVTLDDAVGGGRFVLLGDRFEPAAHLDAEAARTWAALYGVSVGIGGPGGLVDTDGTYARWFAGSGAAVVLVRPDGYVFGTAVASDAASGLVRDLAERLGLRVPAN